MNREVWVVDDDRGRLDSMLALMRERNITSRGFSEPRRLLARALTDAPAVVITELAMDGMSGVELARALRESLASACPRIVLIATGSGAVRRAELTLFDHVVHKPFRFASLLPRIQAYLKQGLRRGRHSHVRLTGVSPRKLRGERE